MNPDEQAKRVLHYLGILGQLRSTFHECEFRWRYAKGVHILPGGLTIRIAESIGGEIRRFSTPDLLR